MPAYNEEGCIEEVTRGWLSALELVAGDGLKMVVVNDGSRDKTGAILDQVAAGEARLKIVHQSNAGHGAALLNAYKTALSLNPTWVFHVDSDDQFLPRDFTLLWQRRNEAKFLMGQRAKRFDAFHRLVITKILLFFNILLFGARLRDANIPYRLIRADYLKKLLSVIPGDVFAPNIFLAVLAYKDGNLAREIPVEHRDRRTGQVSIVKWRLIKACLRCVKELVVFRINLRRSLIALKESA